jgi:hypothetical protein
MTFVDTSFVMTPLELSEEEIEMNMDVRIVPDYLVYMCRKPNFSEHPRERWALGSLFGDQQNLRAGKLLQLRESRATVRRELLDDDEGKGSILILRLTMQNIKHYELLIVCTLADGFHSE